MICPGTWLDVIVGVTKTTVYIIVDVGVFVEVVVTVFVRVAVGGIIVAVLVNVEVGGTGVFVNVGVTHFDIVALALFSIWLPQFHNCS